MAYVFWLTGLSGSGKTTIAQKLVEQLRNQKLSVIFLDGDRLREIFGNQHGYDEATRRQLSLWYARLCALLSEQGMTVVCSTVSLFHDTQRWNRKHIKKYIEVFVRVDLAVLENRNSKNVYAKKTSVMGVNIPAEFPEAPDIVVDNHDGSSVDVHVNNIITFFNNYQNVMCE